MNKKRCLHTLLLTTGIFASAYTQEKPNIVFILADDLGYGSINSYGAPEDLVRTPNINEIAEKGLQFNNAHTPASVCSPTRYGLLTGEYPWRTSLKYGVVNAGEPFLPDPDDTSLADWLKQRGYNTAMIGKWHLGYRSEKPVDYTKQLTPGPLDFGFDYHFGVPQNHGDKLGVYIENDHIYQLRSDEVHPYSKTTYGAPFMGFDAPQRVTKEEMATITDKSIDWLRGQSKEKPFFLYYAAVAVHEPITPSDYMRGLSDCGPYGDFIQDLDYNVGRIIQTLKYLDLMDNTIIVFTSDNGGDIPGNKKSANQQAIEAGLKINGDLRGDKHLIYEGGTKVPFIISWPGHIPAGAESNELINLVDFFATISEITDGKVPESKEIAPDSYSFASILKKPEAVTKRSYMVTSDVSGLHAIRQGKWKYIDNTLPEGLPESKYKFIKLERSGNEFKPALYNLEEDPAEQNNVIEQYPQIAKELKDELNNIRENQYSRYHGLF